MGLSLVQRTKEQQQEESLHGVFEPGGEGVPRHLRDTAVNSCPCLLPKVFPARGVLQALLHGHQQIVSGWTPVGSTATVQRGLFWGAEPSSTPLISLTHANATLPTLCFNSKQKPALRAGCACVSISRVASKAAWGPCPPLLAILAFNSVDAL